MKALLSWTVGAVVVLGGVTVALSARQRDAGSGAARETLVGAWRLASLDEPGPDGKVRHITDAKGR